MATTKQILNLDSLIDRPTVKVHGQEFWLVTLDIMPPLDAHRLQRASERVTELRGKPALTEDEERELATLPDRMCRMVMPEAPDTVHASLIDPVRMLIVEAAATTFRNGLQMFPPPAAAPSEAETTETSPSTGAN